MIFFENGDAEGEEVAFEMIDNKTVMARPHPGLTPLSKLTWPRTHQFKKGTDEELMNLYVRFIRSSFWGSGGLTAATERALKAELKARRLVG